MVRERKTKTTVFTNGCFDVFHYGHLHLLREARTFGDELIVGINSDSSVKRLKGKTRPIFECKYRKQILTGLIFVDGVIEYDEDTPLELIKKVRPNVLVKGADWKEKDIVGADFVKACGGLVKRVKLILGFSTSAIVNERKNYQHHLLNILAVVHRDGGHYTEKHGLEKAVKDGMKIISDAIVRED